MEVDAAANRLSGLLAFGKDGFGGNINSFPEISVRYFFQNLPIPSSAQL
jgi:hypothetical protein